MRKVFEYLKINKPVSELCTTKCAGFLPKELCGCYQIFSSGNKKNEICYCFDKEKIVCKRSVQDLEAEVCEFQILNFNFQKNRCLARRMEIDNGKEEFVNFYFERKDTCFLKILQLDFQSFAEAENHKLPVDYRKSSDKNWQWFCLQN